MSTYARFSFEIHTPAGVQRHSSNGYFADVLRGVNTLAARVKATVVHLLP